MLTELLNRWMAAERVASRAEDKMHAAVALHLQTGAALPSQHDQQSADVLRKNADLLFAEVRAKARELEALGSSRIGSTSEPKAEFD